jgi:hypothetical protein
VQAVLQCLKEGLWALLLVRASSAASPLSLQLEIDRRTGGPAGCVKRYQECDQRNNTREIAGGAESSLIYNAASIIECTHSKYARHFLHQLIKATYIRYQQTYRIESPSLAYYKKIHIELRQRPCTKIIPR